MCFLLLSQAVALQQLLLSAYRCDAPWLPRSLQLHLLGLVLFLLQATQHRQWRLRRAVQQLLRPSCVANDWLMTPLEEEPRRARYMG